MIFQMFILPDNFTKWKKKFTIDFKKKEFMPIKFLFFLIFGANVSLIPFLTLQARSLGITEEEVGIIYSFIPIASLIAPALTGMLADKIGNFRIFLSIATGLAGLSSLLFILVPPGRVTHSLPDSLPIEVTCSASLQGEGASLRPAAPFGCDPAKGVDAFEVQIDECVVTCLNNETAWEDLLSENGWEVNLRCQTGLDCLSDSSSAADDFSLAEEESSNSSLVYYQVRNTTEATTVLVNVTWHNVTSPGGGHVWYESGQPLCPNYYHESGSASSGPCVSTCKGRTPRRKEMCSNQVTVQEFDPALTFYSHLVVRLLKEFTLATSMPLLEGAAVTILQEHNGDFGFQRMYCNVGMMIMTPISGTLIDFFSKKNGFEDFRPAIYMYCGLKLTAAFIILFLNLKFKEASTQVISGFSSLMVNPQILIFLLATFLAGTCYGYIETFLFWLLEDLGADKQLMGITITIGSVFGIPLLMISTYILRKLGHVNTIVLGFMVYIVRLFGYTIISSPWWAMPFEALECFTVSLMVVAFVSYASLLASPTTVVTLQGLYGGLYNGVGRGAGSLIGGFLIESIGILQTFRVIAAIGGASGIGYLAINKCCFKKTGRNSVVQDIETDSKDKTDKKSKKNGDIPTELENPEDKYKINSLKPKKELMDKGKKQIVKSITGNENKGFEREYTT